MFEARAGREVMLLVRLADSRRIKPNLHQRPLLIAYLKSYNRNNELKVKMDPMGPIPALRP